MGDRSVADVYVQVPAYRDRELSATLLDLYARASRPERLRTCVVWQHAPGEELDPAVRGLDVEVVAVPYQRSGGCNWARALLQDNWAGEPYTLLIDSHHRFAQGWDDLVVGMYEQLRASGVERPLLTAYLPPYDADDPAVRGGRPFKTYPLARDHGVLTRLIGYPLALPHTLSAPVPAEFLSLHFVFADGAFNTAVRFDPDIYFFGDEVLTGLRAFTWGYDLFHPHAVVGWHLYDRVSRVTHWADHDRWYEQQARSLAKLREVFGGGAAADGWLGPHRTIRDYEDWIMAALVEPA